jgi:hypothetical protein
LQLRLRSVLNGALDPSGLVTVVMEATEHLMGSVKLRARSVERPSPTASLVGQRDASVVATFVAPMTRHLSLQLRAFDRERRRPKELVRAAVRRLLRAGLHRAFCHQLR